MRKFVIGIVSFAVVLGVFVLYSRMDKTPSINIGAGRDSNAGIYDGNSNDFNNIGTIGEAGIGRTEKFEYITRNPESGEIERKFGFQKLLHTEGDLWELEQPYMDIYRKDFTCSMKADHGMVQVEKIGSDTIPKNATFGGNVVINILPGKKGDIEESTIYLENLTFNSEKSQLSTPGDLKFVSKNVHLNGSGMEMVYNSDMERLEFFRIITLEKMSVRIKRDTLGTISKQTTQPAKITKEGNIRDQNEVTAVSQEQNKPENKYYTCLFSKNVLIDTPDQRVFASDEIEIDDILWSKKIYDANDSDESNTEIDSNDPNQIIDDPNKPYQNVVEDTNNPAAFAAEEPNDIEEPSDDLIDVVLTCDNGFIVAPKDSRKLSEFKEMAQNLNNIEKPAIEEATGKTTLETQKIQLTTLEGDSVASGPTELTFYVEDLNVPDPNLQSFPVTLTSQKGARFIKAANQVVFEGDSICRIPQKQMSEEKDITFSSPMLIINLPKSKVEKVSSLSDIIAIGPTELVFYVEDSNSEVADSNSENETYKIIPVRITSQEKALFLPAMNQVIFDKDCLCEVGSEETGKERYVSLKSSNLKIDLPREYSAQSFAFSDITAAGPINLKFFMKDPNNMGTPQSLLPVTITAQNQARYDSTTRQIIADGSCRSSMLRQDENFIQELTLLAQDITVDLPKDVNDNNPTSSLTQIKHLNADGDQVTLKVTKKAKACLIHNQSSDQVLGGTKLVCKSLDYDTEEQIFKATGPGELTLSNTEIKDLKEQEGNSILGKQWYADTNGFSDLEYSLNQNRIIANAEPNKTINVQYIETENGKYSPVLMAAAGHVEIQLKETDDGKVEPSTVVASGGIDYKKDENNRFLGSVLIYDHEKSTITIHGDEKNPCYSNGFLADEIFIDLNNNGSIKVTSSSPSSL